MKRKDLWPVVLVIVLCFAGVGVFVTLDIVRTEGWDGIWNQKKNFIEGIRPGSKSMSA